MTYSNGVVTTFGYDQRHRPVSIASEKNGLELLHLEYTYDSVGNVLQLINSWIDPITQLPETTNDSFGYDALDRLTSASNGYGTLSFSYDPTGNRIQQILNGNTTTYTYSPYDKLATAGEWAFTYDANGNTLSKVGSTDEWLYEYDSADRLAEVEHNGQLVGYYIYDGDGQRIKKTEWNPDSQQYETIIYLYSWGSVYYEENVITGLDAVYIYGPAGRIAKRVGEEIMYYHTDHLGSTRMLTDAVGVSMTAVEYYPFGTPELTGEKERYLFTGQEIDSTRLYYYKARYYDLETGRFLTQDKWSGDIRRPQSLNKYVYCGNNPLRYADPSGNIPTYKDEIPDNVSEGSDGEDEDSEIKSNVKGPQSDDPTYLLGYWLSFYTAYKMAHKMDPKGWNISQDQMNSFLEELGIEDQEKFMEGWADGFSDGNYAYAEDANKRLDTEVAQLEKDLQCLLNFASDELISNSDNFFSLPENLTFLLVVIWMCEEIYNLACTDKYRNFPRPNLDQLCREEEEDDGTCSGTILLLIFAGLAILSISIQWKEEILR